MVKVLVAAAATLYLGEEISSVCVTGNFSESTAQKIISLLLEEKQN